MRYPPPSVDRVNAESSGGGHAASGAVLGGTAGDGWGRAAAYDAYADGLHTYALWYLRDHDAAADAVYCAFVAADRNHTNLQQPEQIQPWLYALLRRECRLRATEPGGPTPVSPRLRPKSDCLGESGVADSLLQLEGNLRRAEFQSLAWPEAEGLTPAHREVLELTIRHGLDSRGLALVLGLREGAAGLAPSRGFGLLADAWRELERSLAAAAVAASGRENCAQLAELTFGWSGRLNATLRAPLTDHVDGCSRCQHYLHTVIGTPSAPTILPYVAAPRALREILLSEVASASLAEQAGVDLVALGGRCGGFGPDGFPARTDPPHPGPNGDGGAGAAAGAGRGPRRRMMMAGSTGRSVRGGQRTAVPPPRAAANPSPSSPGSSPPAQSPAVSSSTVGFTTTTAGTALLDAAGPDGAASAVGFTATATGSAYLHATARPAGGATVGFTATAAGTAIFGAREAVDEADDGRGGTGPAAGNPSASPQAASMPSWPLRRGAPGAATQPSTTAPRPEQGSHRAANPNQSPNQSPNASPNPNPGANPNPNQWADSGTGHGVNPGSNPAAGSGQAAGSSPGAPGAARTDAVPGSAGGRPRPRMPESDELFRASGSWADRVLPPQQAAGAGALAAAAVDMNDLWRPEPTATFVQTASGRFATRAPQHPAADDPEVGESRPRSRSRAESRSHSDDSRSRTESGAQADSRSRTGSGAHSGSAAHSDSTSRTDSGSRTEFGAVPGAAGSGGGSVPASSGHARAARYAPGGKPAPKPAAKPAPAGVRPRHKARPMRQAVVSAMALGAIGAVAAAAAAMLGATSSGHSNATALDGTQPGTPLGHATSGSPASTGPGNLTVSVTAGDTGPGGGTSGVGSGVPASGLPGAPLGATSATPTTASSGAFYVSVNQRAADPDSVQILVRNAGTAPLHWSAAPTVGWLTLSQGSGTLAPGQAAMVTATAGAAAPSGQWAAQILFSPGGIVVTVHGGIPADSGGGGGGTVGGSPMTPTPTGSTPSSPSPSPTPTQTSQSPGPSPSSGTGTVTATPSGGATSQSPTTTSGASGGGTGTPSSSVVGSPARPARGH